MREKKERIDYIDSLKAFLIILVVIGHSKIFDAYFIIQSVHMPAFLVISGFFFKPCKFKSQLIKSARSTLPYYITTGSMTQTSPAPVTTIVSMPDMTETTTVQESLPQNNNYDIPEDMKEVRLEVAELVNQSRVSNNLGRLYVDGGLCRAADLRAVELSELWDIQSLCENLLMLYLYCTRIFCLSGSNHFEMDKFTAGLLLSRIKNYRKLR